MKVLSKSFKERIEAFFNNERKKETTLSREDEALDIGSLVGSMKNWDEILEAKKIINQIREQYKPDLNGSYYCDIIENKMVLFVIEKSSDFFKLDNTDERVEMFVWIMNIAKPYLATFDKSVVVKSAELLLRGIIKEPYMSKVLDAVYPHIELDLNDVIYHFLLEEGKDEKQLLWLLKKTTLLQNQDMLSVVVKKCTRETILEVMKYHYLKYENDSHTNMKAHCIRAQNYLIDAANDTFIGKNLILGYWALDSRRKESLLVAYNNAEE